jgi:hypothetical protein
LKAQEIVEMLVWKLFKVVAGPKGYWWMDLSVLIRNADYPDILCQLPYTAASGQGMDPIMALTGCPQFW